MKATLVPLKNLLPKKLFIVHCRDLTKRCCIYKKTDNGAIFFESEMPAELSEDTDVIVVRKTTFGKLSNGHEFLFVEDAKKEGGFDTVEEIYVKEGAEYATEPLPERKVRWTNISPQTGVIDLAHAFNFRRAIFVEFNI